MLNVTNTKSAIVISNQEGEFVRYQFEKGGVTTFTNIQKSSSTLIELKNKIKSAIVNFKDTKRDYSQRIRTIAKEMAEATTGYKSLSSINRKIA